MVFFIHISNNRTEIDNNFIDEYFKFSLKSQKFDQSFDTMFELSSDCCLALKISGKLVLKKC